MSDDEQDTAATTTANSDSEYDDKSAEGRKRKSGRKRKATAGLYSFFITQQPILKIDSNFTIS